MSTTAILKRESETQLRKKQAEAHRRRGFPGDEAWAKTEEHLIQEIRARRVKGDSTMLRFCPRCLEKSVKLLLLEDGHGRRWCGTCRHKEDRK